MPEEQPPPSKPTPPKEKPPDPLLAAVPSVAVDRLRQEWPDRFEDPHYFAGEVTLTVDAQHLKETCRFLRDDPECRFELLADLSGVDFPEREKRFRVVYHLASVKHTTRLRLRVEAPEGSSLASVSEIWPGADWYEREVFDLFGLEFEGHPNLVRILMPDDWTGYPLRKDYPLPGYPEQHLRYRTADVARRSYVDFSWKATGEKAAAIVKKYSGKGPTPEISPHVPMPETPPEEPQS